MKELTNNQKNLADTAVRALKKLQSLGIDGDAFIAQLNGISYAEFLKGGEK